MVNYLFEIPSEGIQNDLLGERNLFGDLYRSRLGGVLDHPHILPVGVTIKYLLRITSNNSTPDTIIGRIFVVVVVVVVVNPQSILEELLDGSACSPV